MNLPLWLRRLLRQPGPYADAFRRELGNAANSVHVPDREPRFARRGHMSEGIDVPRESDFPSQYGHYREGIW